MIKKNINEFIENSENLIKGAIVNDEYITITTECGNAVLISEKEWEMLVSALKQSIDQK